MRLDHWIMAVEAEVLQAAAAGKPAPKREPGSAPPVSLETWVDGDKATKETGYTVQSTTVPTTWEREGLPKTLEGPVWFATRLPEISGDKPAVRIAFAAVSYFATVWLDGVRLGDHSGMWDEFHFDVSPAEASGGLLALEVYKPWERFPVRESLAGFIPYVTTTFGGIWQPVTVESRGDLLVESAWARHNVDGEPVVQLRIDSTHAVGRASVVTRSPGDERAALVDLVRGVTEVEVPAPALPMWSPDSPVLEELEVTIDAGKAKTVHRFNAGLSHIELRGKNAYLNGQPVFPRGLLHWMAYPDLFAPTPPKETVRQEFARARELGYNMIKLCLVVPPEYYFSIADEMGMLLWVEMPMWDPKVSPEYKERAKTQYRRILRSIRRHPSVFMYTIGCELSSEAGAEFLKEMYDLVKAETGSPLVRDNSGSAEAYGGVDQEFADFHDYHFYAEATQFTDLLDYFVPSWKSNKPLYFGEYCDSDTFRDIAALKKELGRDFYWTHDDPVLNPQGVRWDYNIVTNEARLADLDVGIEFDEIRDRSYRRSLEYRKSIIEQTRAHPSASGYVVTNLQDTPITTSGMLDDLGRHKFDAATFRRFNADSVLTVARGRRRIWLRGGDRRQFLDHHCLRSEEEFRLHMLFSHVGVDITTAELSYRFAPTGNDESVRGVASAAADTNASDPATPSTEGTLPITSVTGNGEPGLIAALDLCAPSAEGRVLSYTLELTLRSDGQEIATNRFVYWVFPASRLAAKRQKTAGADAAPLLAFFDPFGDFSAALPPGAPAARVTSGDDVAALSEHLPLVATAVEPWVLEAARNGRRVVLALADSGEPTSIEAPFFREAIGLVHEDPLMASLPHGGYAGTAFSGAAPDRALDRGVVAAWARGSIRPIITRLDARVFTTSLYLCAADASGDGNANLFATTLRLWGGAGRMPFGLRHNVLGAYLLEAMLGL